MNAIKLMIADDQPILREGMRCLFEFDEGFQIIAEADNLCDCLEQVMKWKPDVLILEPCLSDNMGLEVLKTIKNDFSLKTKVIVLIGKPEADYLFGAIELEADGYLLKNVNILDLKKVIRLVMSGGRYIQPVILKKMNESLEEWKLEKQKIDRLTKRELEVLRHLSVGMYNKEIALKLAISERTVKNHVFSVFKKIGVTDRTQAAVFAVRHHLVNLSFF